jgi:hypothetical protein
MTKSLWQQVLVRLGFESETVPGDGVRPGSVPPWLDPAPEPPAAPTSSPFVPGRGPAGDAGLDAEESPTAPHALAPEVPEPAASEIPSPPRPPRATPHVVQPREPDAMVEVGIHLRANETVVLDLRDLDPALRRRFIDVSAGLVYGMEGQMARGTDERYVLRPPGTAP